MHRDVLVVDDDPAMCELLETGLRCCGVSTQCRGSAEQALQAVADHRFDAVVTDLRLPGMDGVELCRRLAATHRELRVIIMTAFGSFDAAVAALRAGAHDVLAKPFDIDELAASLSRAMAPSHKRARPRHGSTRTLVGTSPAMESVRRVIDRVARSDANVLVVGETGTGKELVARAIHDASQRHEGPFVGINCAAVPESLAESELFGHAKGAYTDAHAARAGLFARANRGTLFLDEISELSLRLQAKILRALEERAVRPIGSSNEEPFDARIIAASNQNLQQAVDDGRFRADLLFRLRVVQIDLPPLRERGDDVIALVEHFLAERAEDDPRRLSAGAAAALRNHAWPGNVRELRNCIERALMMSSEVELAAGDVLPQLPEARVGADPADPTGLDPLGVVERKHVVAVLDAVEGNRARAARILGIGRKTLYRKLAEYGLAPRGVS